MTMTNDATRATADQFHAVAEAAQAYFDLLYTSDAELFSRVFHDQAWLFTQQDGRFSAMTAADYRSLLAGRTSPRSLGAPREDQIISIDFSAATHALVKVRVRINQAVFVDYLSMLKLDVGWRIVSKTYYRLPE
jgi:hypothetical protein